MSRLTAPIEAVVLAGGEGTRLKEWAKIIPKPLVTLDEVPVLEVVLRQLARYGFRNVAVRLCYFEEESPLGTAGPLGGISGLAEHFLVLNGDLLTTLDFRALFEEHLRGEALLTVDKRVTGYVEKPSLHYRVSMGIYVFNHGVLNYIERGVRLDFPDLVLRLLEAGEDVRYFPFDGYWLDIGRGEDYERARDDFPRMRKALLGEGE